MRKIEEQMIQAIKDNKAWRSGNTEVTLGSDGVSYVFLHGNLIAEVGDTFVRVFDGGWRTVTTKSRLNSIINAFCNAYTDGIFQHKFNWFIRDCELVHEFEDGYVFS